MVAELRASRILKLALQRYSANINCLPRPLVSTISTHHEISLCLIRVSVYQSAHSFLFYKFGQSRFVLSRAVRHVQRAENRRDANI